MASPGVQFAFVLNTTLILVVLVAYGYWRRTRMDDSADQGTASDSTWYEDAAELARETQSAVDPSNAVVDADTVRRRLVPLSNRLRAHARSAPSTIDEQLIGDVYELGMDCYTVGMEHTTQRAIHTGTFMEDKLEEIRVSAEELETSVLSRL